jgi:hypothetical protein
MQEPTEHLPANNRPVPGCGRDRDWAAPAQPLMRPSLVGELDERLQRSLHQALAQAGEVVQALGLG